MKTTRWLNSVAMGVVVLTMACDPDQPVAWVYYGDSAIGLGVQFVTRLHHCDYSDQTTGGLPVFNWNEERQATMGNVIANFTEMGRGVIVWMTIGTVDRSFYIHSDVVIAATIEDRAREILGMGAMRVVYVSYNDIHPDPTDPFITRQGYVDVIDFDSIPGFSFVDLRDLNDIVVGVDNFHYSPEEHYLRAGAVHARVGGLACK